MSLVLFLAWVVFVFVCCDLVGATVSRRRESPQSSGTLDRGHAGLSSDGPEAPVDFAYSTLLGFATLWAGLSMAYAAGIATRGVIVAFTAACATVAALTRRGRLLPWVRCRLPFWGAIGGMALLASFVAPTFNGHDDPEYFFLINKLLGTGSVVEYFNYRRPITLGGWSFIQAIFAAGPAGVAFVASIDAVFGGILFLLCALLLGTGVGEALAAALIGVLVAQGFQINLGTTIALAAFAAVLTTIALPVPARRSTLMPTVFAVMALTVRPQLGLVALTAVAVVAFRHRDRRSLLGIAVFGGLALLWIAIFLRDTGLLPMSSEPGYNPQTVELYAAQPTLRMALPEQIATLWQDHWAAVCLVVLALVTCVSEAIMRRDDAVTRGEASALACFAVAVVATLLVMFFVLRSRFSRYDRYYMPIADGFLYVFLLRSLIHLFRSASRWLTTYRFLRPVVILGVLSLMVFGSLGKLSLPAASAERICSRLLTSDEQRAFERVASRTGLILLAINCPDGSFEPSPRVMLNDLFFATRGYYFDIGWPLAETASWLRGHGVDQLVYLEKDTSPTYGLNTWRTYLERLKSDASESAIWRTREYTYQLRSLEKLRELARACGSREMPIHDPQGPLVVVDVGRCPGLTAGSG